MSSIPEHSIACMYSVHQFSCYLVPMAHKICELVLGPISKTMKTYIPGSLISKGKPRLGTGLFLADPKHIVQLQNFVTHQNIFGSYQKSLNVFGNNQVIFRNSDTPTLLT